jgi:hypothetical protein
LSELTYYGDIPDARVVYAVHAVRPAEISATVLVTSAQAAAEQYAATLSRDPGVLAGAVTRFTLDAPGRRTAIALYVGGERQHAPYVSDDRQVLANGHGNRRLQ